LRIKSGLSVNRLVRSDCANGISLVEVASSRFSSLGGVRIVRLGLESPGALDVLISVRGKSSVASFVGGIAINDLRDRISF